MKRALGVLAGGLLTALLPAGLHALRGATAQEASQDELSQTLARLQSEIATEREAIRALESNLDDQGLAETRRSLATELLGLRLELETTTLERKRLEASRDASQSPARTAQSNRSAVLSALRSSLNGLDIHLREVPGQDDLRRRLGELDLEQTPGALFEHLGTALEEGSRISSRQVELPTASGRVEADVSLLLLGHAAFAYRTEDDRLGLALASPIQASGYRWSESIDPQTGDLLRQAFATLSKDSSNSSWIHFPLDLTGQLLPEELRVQQGLRAKLESGGPLMVPLALVALAALVLGMERFWVLFLRTRRSGAFARDVLVAAEAKDVPRATQLCSATDSPVARTMGACLRRHGQGQTAMEDAIQEQLLHEAPSLRRYLRTLTILASVAPLVGLLGTVTGIIQTFGVIRALGTTDPTSMADGISVALVTTATGLSIAIPILLLLGVLRGRGDRILSDVERYAASLLVVLAHGSSDGGSKDA